MTKWCNYFYSISTHTGKFADRFLQSLMVHCTACSSGSVDSRSSVCSVAKKSKMAQKNVGIVKGILHHWNPQPTTEVSSLLPFNFTVHERNQRDRKKVCYLLPPKIHSDRHWSVDKPEEILNEAYWKYFIAPFFFFKCWDTVTMIYVVTV